MPVNIITRRMQEIGRIRLGDRGGTNNAPRRLDKFRLTSVDRVPLEAAAKLWGGTVKPWKGGAEGAFELYTTQPELPIRVIVNQPMSQWYELWSAGGCQRRCDGITEIISNGECKCDPESRECKLKSRFSVLLPDLPGVGSWRVETGGYYAAVELPGVFDLLTGYARQSSFPPATLAIEIRKVVRDGQTKKFPVVTIRVKQSIAELLGDGHKAIEAPQMRQIEAKVETPAPEEVPAPVKPTVAAPETWRDRFCILAKVQPNDPLAIIEAIQGLTGEVLTNQQYDRLKDQDYHAFCDRWVKRAEQDAKAAAAQEKLL